MCFSLAWLENVLIYLVIVGAVYAILKLLIPFVASQFPPIIGQVLNIILWAVIAILVIIICFGVISCLLSGGAGLSLMPPRPH